MPVPGISLAGSMPAVDDLLEQLHALVEAERIGLAGGAERGEARAAFLHQPLAVLDEPVGIGRAILAEGSENRGDHAGESRCRLHGIILGWRA